MQDYKNINKKFISDIDDLARLGFEKLKEFSKENTMIQVIEYLLVIPDRIYDEYSLNDSIEVSISLTTKESTFYYCGVEVKPKCVYIRPANYKTVPLLRILQECVKQNTYRPNIIPLELGEVE